MQLSVRTSDMFEKLFTHRLPRPNRPSRGRTKSLLPQLPKPNRPSRPRTQSLTPQLPWPNRSSRRRPNSLFPQLTWPNRPSRHRPQCLTPNYPGRIGQVADGRKVCCRSYAGEGHGEKITSHIRKPCRNRTFMNVYQSIGELSLKK